MNTNRRFTMVVAAAAAVSIASLEARAGFVNTAVRGLDLVGFNYYGGQNVLTGGREFLATNTFNGNPLEFGPWSLTLQGPLSTGFSIANRPFQSFEFTFGTSASSSATASPLTYSLNYNLGDQSASFSGSLLIDGGARIDRLGFYSVNLDVSSRATAANSGAGATSNAFDLDLGPVNIAGNVFIDALAVLTAPLFDNAGVESPFASLTARNQLQAIVDIQTTELLSLLQTGLTPGDTTAQRGFSLALPDQAAAGPGLLPFNAAGIVVPEPTVLVLLVVGGLSVASLRAMRSRRLRFRPPAR